MFTCVNAARSLYTEGTLGMYRGDGDGLLGLFVAGFKDERREEKDGKEEEETEVEEADEWGAPRPGRSY